MGDVHIDAVDVGDSHQLVAWNEVLREGYSEQREAVWWRSPQATVSQFQSPKPGRVSLALLAVKDGRPVGAAEAHVDTGGPAEVELAVLPMYRRQHVGLLLARAVVDSLSAHAEVAQVETYSSTGITFAEHLGLVVGNQEFRQLLTLPISIEHLESLARPTSGVEIRSWIGPCPQDLVQDWAMLTTQMNADVPLGELSRAIEATDVAVIRLNEERLQTRGYVLVRSLAQIEGEGAGYTDILVSRHDPQIVVQDDTLVEREHRGRGIGRALKVANLHQLSRVPEAASARWVQTYTATSNAPMLALNRDVGFHEADLMTVLEGPITAAPTTSLC